MTRTALAILLAALALGCRGSSAAQDQARDAILAGPVKYPNGSDSINGYLARPRHADPARAIVLTHGNPGIPGDMRELAEELARHGFVTLAVDANSRTPDHSRLELHVIRSYGFHRQWMSDIAAGIEYLRRQAFVRGERVGMVGFCGGGVVNLLYASQSDDVEAVAALYAAPRFPPERNSPTDPKPSLMDFVDQVKVPVQYHYGTADHMIGRSEVEGLRSRLGEIAARAEIHLYEGADHGFVSRESPNYSAAASAMARERLIGFLKQELR